ncbi:TRAP transporter small permease [Haloferax namakaokahaiae]|uniref:TRAP transporter small permease n=1 Tax=Haloferax namakaokahaiae TaxID=1748331 RepID=A0ABD5ZJD7_9EURY
MAQDWFDKLSIAVGVSLLGIILLVGIIQILNRYVGIPINLNWTFEVARTFLAFLTLAGLPYLFKHDSDISFLPVLQRITTRTDSFLLLRNVILLAFSVIMVWSSYLANNVTGDVGLPMIGWFKVGWGFMFLGLSFALLFVYVLIDTRDRLKVIKGEANV